MSSSGNSLRNTLNTESRISQYLGRRMLHPATMREYRRDEIKTGPMRISLDEPTLTPC